MPRTQIFQLGEAVGVVTDAAEERDFLDTLAESIGELENGTPLRPILEAGFDIVCKFRGYTAGVMQPAQHSLLVLDDGAGEARHVLVATAGGAWTDAMDEVVRRFALVSVQKRKAELLA